MQYSIISEAKRMKVPPLPSGKADNWFAKTGGDSTYNNGQHSYEGPTVKD